MFCVISQWSSNAELDDQLISLTQSTFVPAVMALGAQDVYFVQTGPNSIQVVTIYPDEQTANSARDKQEAVRAQASVEMPVAYLSEVRGRIFAHNM